VKAMTNSWTTAGALILLAVIFAILSVLYWVGAIQLFTSVGHGPHHTHAYLFGGLAILTLIGANFLRPKNAPDF
jgi:hypothetical protein